VIALAKPVEYVPAGSLTTLHHKASGCRDCPLWRNATHTVLGKGPAHAVAMLIGEQPGAQEDRTGGTVCRAHLERPGDDGSPALGAAHG
jgi:DNA polymerase